MNLIRKIFQFNLILMCGFVFILSSCHFKNSADAYPDFNTINSASECALVNGFWGVKTCFKNLESIKTKEDCIAAQALYVNSKSDVVCYQNISVLPKDVCLAGGYRWNPSSGLCTSSGIIN